MRVLFWALNNIKPYILQKLKKSLNFSIKNSQNVKKLVEHFTGEKEHFTGEKVIFNNFSQYTLKFKNCDF